MPGPKSAQFKVAFTGTNSSGKTTMALETTARLKRQYHVLAEVVSSQDRKITWKDEHFPVDPRAHYGMISNLVKAEVEAELKGDATIVITDRSVLDLYAIALTDHLNDQKILGMRGYIESWLSTYTKIYYLAPLEYQEDGKRPPNEFRLRTHETLLKLIENWNIPNIVTTMSQSRPDIFSDILHVLDIKKDKTEYAEKEKWQALSTNLNRILMVKKPEWPSTSDQDVWVIVETFAEYKNGAIVKEARDMIAAFFGADKLVDILTVPIEVLTAGLPKGNVTVYYPNNTNHLNARK